MPIPTYDGAPMFGIMVNITVADNPRDEQRDSFFGVSGVERKDGGSRGRVIRAKGVLEGIDYTGLAAAESFFRSYHDGVPRTLTDTLGLVWAWAKLTRFEPQGIAHLTTDGTVVREYEAEFEVPN